MGTWNYKLKGNDTFLDIYQNFFEAYNDGKDPEDVSNDIQNSFADMFTNVDDRNDCLFGLALAQWETKSLSSEIYLKVKEIIETGDDLKRWKNLGANEKLIQKRKAELDKFLLQISTAKEKAKRRSRAKFNFKLEKLLTLPAADGRKVFEICESYVNEKYQDTHAMMYWAAGGGAIFYFYEQGRSVTARWIDNQTLEITHDKNIQFVKKEETFFFCGDEVIVEYLPK